MNVVVVVVVVVVECLFLVSFFTHLFYSSVNMKAKYSNRTLMLRTF